MSQKHQLFLEFPENTNEGILRIEDASIYASSIPVDCATLEITPPGCSTPTVLTGLSQGFRLYLNACQLGLLSVGCDSNCPSISDGIYNIRYSVSPNDKVSISYNLLRINSIMNRWYKTLCYINDRCGSPLNDTLQLIREVQLIESQIITAKHLVEDMHDYEIAMEMYRYADKKLNELSRGCHYC